MSPKTTRAKSATRTRRPAKPARTTSRRTMAKKVMCVCGERVAPGDKSHEECRGTPMQPRHVAKRA